MGLDPARFEVVIAVRRVDGEAMTADDLAAARAALAAAGAQQTAPAPQAPAYPPAMADLHAVATGAKPAAE